MLTQEFISNCVWYDKNSANLEVHWIYVAYLMLSFDWLIAWWWLWIREVINISLYRSLVARCSGNIFSYVYVSACQRHLAFAWLLNKLSVVNMLGWRCYHHCTWWLQGFGHYTSSSIDCLSGVGATGQRYEHSHCKTITSAAVNFRCYAK